MSENEEKVIEISQEELDKLPKNTVHCFPASKSQILKRRIITLIVMALMCGLVGYLLVAGEQPSPLIWIVSGAIFLIAAIVFIHTFVIAKYRVAMDYKNNEVVLRYMFSKIKIPYDSFDAREGAADRATQMLQNSTLGANMKKLDYLVLDNVYEEVCYQTSSKDLATKEDFDTLSKEAKLVASVYKAKEKYDALKTDDEKAADAAKKDDFTSLVHDAMDEDKEEKAAEAKAKMEAAEREAEQILNEEKEKAEATVEDVKESAEDAVKDVVEDVKEAVDEKKED
ncbi:MAG: hypothetical protein IKG93_07500 [Clostridiales bacterium]|nr:hypothetical protein [Clostridiales bacterium]